MKNYHYRSERLVAYPAAMPPTASVMPAIESVEVVSPGCMVWTDVLERGEDDTHQDVKPGKQGP